MIDWCRYLFEQLFRYSTNQKAKVVSAFSTPIGFKTSKISFSFCRKLFFSTWQQTGNRSIRFVVLSFVQWLIRFLKLALIRLLNVFLSHSLEKISTRIQFGLSRTFRQILSSFKGDDIYEPCLHWFSLIHHLVNERCSFSVLSNINEIFRIRIDKHFLLFYQISFDRKFVSAKMSC